MAFTCVVCGLDIAVGEPILADDRMSTAHQRCIEFERKAAETEKPAVMPAPIASVKELPRPSVCEFIPPSKPSTCAVCSERCIAMCPWCMTLVCQAYGWNGKTCSVKHEEKCIGAKAAREPYRSSPSAGTVLITRSPIYDTEPIVIKKKSPKKKRRSR